MPIPYFCPNSSCFCHSFGPHTSGKRWHRKNGFYHTATYGYVQRYKCLCCNRGFSDQTFSIDYYAKRKLSYRRILNQLISTGSIRDMSREFHATTGTIQSRIDRLSRQCIAVQGRLMDKIQLNEELMEKGKWLHTWTNSKEARTGWNPLFAVNYLDRQIRKDLSRMFGSRNLNPRCGVREVGDTCPSISPLKERRTWIHDK